MVEVEMNEDIRKYETKLIGQFTSRQVKGSALGIIFGVILMFISSGILGISDIEIKIAIALIGALPFFMCGFGKMYGLPYEIYFSRFIYRLICPRVRKYKSTTYRDELRKIRKEKEREKLNGMSKKEQKQYQKHKVQYSKEKKCKIYR